MDKIWKKTLCLQNYYISEGNIAGLVAACEVLDFRLVNRLLLDNCGVTGDRFAEIRQGMGKMRDFKSLIYKHSSVNQASLDALKPILLKRIPHQLEELKLIDVKISPSMITFLMESLIEQS